jgi:hypothetical protein
MPPGHPLQSFGDANAARGSAGRSPSAPRRNGLRVRRDVAALVATTRGYQKIYCVTAQFARAKDRARIEDERTKQYGVPITI